MRAPAFLIALAALVVAGLLVLAPAAARADERIFAFNSTIEVASDGELTVTETIRVRAEGNQIRRGIFRDIPLVFETESGRKARAGFDLVSVEPRDPDPNVLLSIDSEREVVFTYTNWKGNTSNRRAIMRKLFFGATAYHEEPQWLIEGYDMDKEAVRTYALKDITAARAV